MDKTFDFLKQCEIFFVLTINNGIPTGRPFGAIMKEKDKYYISTGKSKDVYKQLKDEQQATLIALKNGSRDWVRFCGKVIEVDDLFLKNKMLIECPQLKRRFSTALDEEYALFEISEIKFI